MSLLEARTSSLALLLALAPPLAAGDWTNNGGNPARNGLTREIGPDAADLLWSGGRPSIIAWQPVTSGSRVFLVRQTGFPPGGEPNGSPVVAMDLATGAELWAANIPFNAGDWTTWIAGTSNGLVYASRSGNGASVSARVHALDQATGATVWISTDTIDAGAHDGVVFAPDGDLVVASFTTIKRIDAATGATVWTAARTCSVSGNCGGAISGNAIYIADAVPGGHRVERHDLTTGAFQYAGPVMPGLTLQNSPMVGADGTVYLPRTQNNPITDFFYAFADDGSALVQKWRTAAGWSTSSEFAVGPDGSVYMLGTGGVLQRLDPATGNVVDASTPLAADNWSPRLAVDRFGRIVLSNGSFANGRVYAFDAHLGARWSVPVTNVNIGAPALGEDGTLVVAGVGTDVRAYRTPRGVAIPFCFGDGSLTTPCPCAPPDTVPSPSGAEGRGCANSFNLAGALLAASGTTTPDTLQFNAHIGTGYGNFALLLKGDAILTNGFAVGDGVRCADGALIRFGGHNAGTNGAAMGFWTYPNAVQTLPVSGATLQSPGASAYYQLVYRNPSANFCSSGTINLSNGLAVEW